MKVDKLKSSRIENIEMRRSNKEANFSTQFNNTRKKYGKEELEENLKNIKNIGSRLVLTKNYLDVTQYKKSIQEYFKNIVDNMYDMDKKQGFWVTKLLQQI